MAITDKELRKKFGDAGIELSFNKKVIKNMILELSKCFTMDEYPIMMCLANFNIFSEYKEELLLTTKQIFIISTYPPTYPHLSHVRNVPLADVKDIQTLKSSNMHSKKHKKSPQSLLHPENF